MTASHVEELLGTAEAVHGVFLVQNELGHEKDKDGKITALFSIPKDYEGGQLAYGKALKARLEQAVGNQGLSVTDLPVPYLNAPAYRVTFSERAAIQYEILMRDWERADNDAGQDVSWKDRVAASQGPLTQTPGRRA